MKQKLLKLMLLLCALIAGSGMMWGQTYKKVTAAPTDWSGEYLLVYESGSTAYVWTGVDAASCYSTATISSNTITKPDGAVSLTISSMTGGYSILVNGGTNNGKYMQNNGSSNGIKFVNSAVANTLTYENSAVTITCGGKKLRYNNASGNYRFRYFGSDQQKVQLYKKSYTVTYNANGGSGTMTDSNSPYFMGSTVTTKTNTFTKDGYDFAGWNTASDGSGSDYAEGATFTLNANTTLFAQWSSAVTATDLSVKTEPTKTEYRVGETLDLTGLVLSATIGGTPTDVDEGYTAEISSTTVTSGTTVLSTVGKQTITFSYGGQTTTQDIYVGELKSIEITTAPTTTTYTEGNSFSPTGMVVTATYTDKETSEHTWTATVALSDGESDGYTYSPSGALIQSNTTITVSYTWDEQTKTDTQSINVNAGTAYKVTLNAGTGSCASEYVEGTYVAGVELPTATIGVTGWSFAGWATASTANTEDEPTLYAAGATYNPTEDCTLYAVYKFSEASATSYKRATSVSDITSASSVVIVCNNQSKVLDNTLASGVTAPTESSSKITAPEKAIFTLTGNNTDGYTLTNSTTTVGASSTDNSTVISNTTTNDLWVVKDHGTSNTFYFENKGKSNLCLEYYNSSGYKWMVYAPATPSTNAAVAMKVYVPVTTTVYNSNPAAIVNPTIAWTTSGDKTLYLQNISDFTNAANVTGISKTPVYTSSDATVASVSEAGVVTGLKVGETTIKATVVAETGVNTKAEVSYVVTVKDASDIAGIKAIASNASVVAFTADLTDAVVTYVKDDHAYIQDASGAIYASCGSSLTAGKKINGAVSGSVKAANQIDEITAIDLSGATITDGVIPSATVITAATLAANGANYEGKLVSIEGATVTASLENGKASGGKISDDGKTTEINLYAPDSNIEALKDAEGTFNGYISLFNGSSIRFNIYEQSQISLTKNAPTDQPLSFDTDAVELDEETSAYDAFDGQAVSGAFGDVTYTIDSDESSVVTSIDSETGAVVLSGNIGIATIKASAAAKEVTEAGVTTPYKATTKTYTITVYPRYTVTFSANGVETPVRQASHGAAVAVPSPGDLSGFNFMGWSATTVDLTDDAPSMESLGATITPEANDTYYAVFAVEKTPSAAGSYTLDYDNESALQSSEDWGSYGKSYAYTASDGSSWTIKAYKNSGMQINTGKNACIKLPSCPGNITTIVVTGSKNNYFGFSSSDYTGSGSPSVTPTNNTLDVTTEEVTTGYIIPYTGNNVITKIVVNYGTPATYENYCTTVPAHVNISSTVGYTTYVATDNVSFPVDVTAYIATQVNAETISLEKVLAVPEGTAVVVKGDKGVYMLDVEDAGDCDDVSDNLLLASNGSVTGNGSTIYALGVGKEGVNKDVVGFYLVKSGVTVPAGKAYLNTGALVKEFLTFVFDDLPTTVSEVKNEGVNSEKSIFNLAGQRVDGSRFKVNGSGLKTGIYIVNGKKVLVK